MMMKRLIFGICALLLFLCELIIALFIRDAFIRPYFGDVLVVILLWCVIKTAFPKDRVWITPAIFVFACLFEFTQLIPLVDFLGLTGNPFFETVMGRSFSRLDILCYGCGCLFVFGMETLMRLTRSKNCPIFRFYML